MGSANSSGRKKDTNQDTRTSRRYTRSEESTSKDQNHPNMDADKKQEQNSLNPNSNDKDDGDDDDNRKGKESTVKITLDDPKKMLKRLHAACQKENTAVVEALTAKYRASLASERDPESGKVALHYCISNKETTTAEVVYKCDFSSLNIRDNSGFTPLLLATVAGNLKMVKFFGVKGASVKTADNEGHSASHWAAVCGHEEILAYLQESGADLSVMDKNGATPLHYAVHGNDDVTQEKSLKMTRMLLEKKVNVDAADEDGRTPLLWAASSGREKICELLLDAGANVEAFDQDKLTGLHSAAAKGHPKCIEILLARDATIEASDKNGCTPLFYAIHQSEMDCARLLLNKKANPNHCDSKGRSVTHCAAAAGNLEAMELLKQHEADLWLQSKETGDLPVHEAAMAGHTDVVEFLIGGLDPKTSPKDAINKGNAKGKTCLHMAALSNNLPLCTFLVQNGANVNASMKHENEKLLPYDCAVLKNNEECAKYLVQNGARSRKAVDIINEGKKAQETSKKQRTSKETSCQTDNTDDKKYVELVHNECQTVQPNTKKANDNTNPNAISNNKQRESDKMLDKSIQTMETKTDKKESQTEPKSEGIKETQDVESPKRDKARSPEKGKTQKPSGAEGKDGNNEDRNNHHSSDEGEEDSGTYSEEEKQNTRNVKTKDDDKKKQTKQDQMKSNRNKIHEQSLVESRKLVNLNVHPTIIREQVRAYETKRLAAMKLNHSNRMKMNCKGFGEERLVRKLARDYNEDAREEDRIPSGHFKTLKEFDNFLRGEINIADVDEKRLRKLEKVKPIYYITF